MKTAAQTRLSIRLKALGLRDKATTANRRASFLRGKGRVDAAEKAEIKAADYNSKAAELELVARNS